MPRIRKLLTIYDEANTIACYLGWKCCSRSRKYRRLCSNACYGRKSRLFKEFGGVNAVPICLDTQDTEEIIRTIVNIAPAFGGINLEDISAPRCFEIEERLKELLDIPVFHDDQHGTAIVVLAGIINALKVTGKQKEACQIVVNGAGSAGIAITKLLLTYGFCHVTMCDINGIISKILRFKLDAKKMTEVTQSGREEGNTCRCIARS